MAEKREYLTIVHLQVDAVDSLESVRVRFCQVSDLHVLVVELKASDFRWYGLIVLFVEVLDLKWISDCVSSLTQRCPSLGFLLCKSLRLDIPSTPLPAATHAAEAAVFSLAVGARQDRVQIGGEQKEKDERDHHHGQASDVRKIVNLLGRIAEIEAGL